jgi:uncharacterized protein (DUF2235 family)
MADTAQGGRANAEVPAPIPAAATTKNIVLLSDGTGNSAAAVWRTNVWRVFQSLDLSDSTQVANYDDGVGSSSFKPLAILGGVIGLGLKRNVVELYSFLCRNYQPGDQIYVFGFSRGAYTIRVLVGLIDSQGLVPSNSEAQLRRDAKSAYRAYRERYNTNLSWVVDALRWARNKVSAFWNQNASRFWNRDYYDYARLGAHDKTWPDIRFVGLWDTVAAYGLPIDEMTRGVHLWIWPLELPNRQFSGRIQRACHALSLDDERTTFHPVLWSERELPTEPPPPADPFRPDKDGKRYIENERLSQVWFAGVHANVGGGYPDDSLSHVALSWVMGEARKAGLRFKEDPPGYPDMVATALGGADKDGRLYDSRSGLGGYYRYGPRKLVELCHAQFSSNPNDEVTVQEPKIHWTVFERMRNGAHAYAPIGLPATYAVVGRDGEILAPGDPDNPSEQAGDAKARAGVDPVRPISTSDYWKTYWCARCQLFYATAALLLFFPLFPALYGIENLPSGWDPSVPSFLQSILPDFTRTWLNAYAAHPRGFFIGLTLLGVFAIGSIRRARKPAGILPVPQPGVQENIWNLVWRRRVGYFATLAVSAYLVAFPFIHASEGGGAASPFSFLSPIIRLVGAVLPGFLSTWIDSFAANPGWFLLGALGVAGLMWRSANLATSITDEMRQIWCATLKMAKTAHGAPDVTSRVYRLRTDECYRTFIWAMKRYILPTLFAILFIYLGAVAVTRMAFTLWDSFGGNCRASAGHTATFTTSSRCWMSGEFLEPNNRYRITITVRAPWKDGSIATDPGGYSAEKMTRQKYFALPLRRSLAQPWFKPIVRIGSRGGDEYVLEPVRPVGKDVLGRELVAEITARTRGRLFVYVNDAMGPPGWFDLFYDAWGRNAGTASVTVEHIETAQAPR